MKIVFILFIFFQSIYCSNFSFNELNNKGLNHYLGLKNEELNIDIAKKELEIFKSDDYPTISSGIKKYNNKEVYDKTSTNNDTGYIDIRYTLYDFGKSQHKENYLNSNISLNSYNFCLKKIDFSNELLKNYFELRKIQIQTDSLKYILDLESKNFSIATKLFENKNIDKNNLLEVSLNFSKSNIEYSNLKENQKSFIQKLKQFTNITINENDFLEELEIKDFIFNEKFENSIEAQKINEEINIKKEQIEELSIPFSPTISLFGNYNKNYNNNNLDYSFGLDFKIIIFDGNKEKLTREKIMVEKMKSENSYKIKEEEFTNNINTYYYKKNHLYNKEKETQNIELKINEIDTNNKRLSEQNFITIIQNNNEKIKLLRELINVNLNKENDNYELKQSEIMLGENKCYNQVR